MPNGLGYGDGHGKPVDHPVHLGPAGLSLPGDLLQAGDHRSQQLHYDGGGNVRKHPQGHDAHAAESATAEQVQKPQKLIVAEQVVQLKLVYAGYGNVGHKAVEGQHSQGEEDFGPQIRQAEGVDGRLNQPGPPASLDISSHHCG